jgi:hypothetical protein
MTAVEMMVVAETQTCKECRGDLGHLSYYRQRFGKGARESFLDKCDAISGHPDKFGLHSNTQWNCVKVGARGTSLIGDNKRP